MTIFSMLSSAHRSRSAAFAGVVGLWLSTFAGQVVAAEKAAFLLPGSINDQSWNAQGYEGAVLRTPDGRYRFGTAKHLEAVKIKPPAASARRFQDVWRAPR